MLLMDDVTICDVRARDIGIWQINSQTFRVRKIWKTWFLDIGTFSWQNATYTIQFILTIYINSEKLMLPGRCTPVEFFSWKCGKLRKTKSGYPALIWSFRTSLFSALCWNKISHMKLQSLKIFKTTKDMFYKQFEFFANWEGRLSGFVNIVLSHTCTIINRVCNFCFSEVFNLSVYNILTLHFNCNEVLVFWTNLGGCGWSGSHCEVLKLIASVGVPRRSSNIVQTLK